MKNIKIISNPWIEQLIVIFLDFLHHVAITIPTYKLTSKAIAYSIKELKILSSFFVFIIFSNLYIFSLFSYPLWFLWNLSNLSFCPINILFFLTISSTINNFFPNSSFNKGSHSCLAANTPIFFWKGLTSLDPPLPPLYSECDSLTLLCRCMVTGSSSNIEYWLRWMTLEVYDRSSV